MPFYRLYSLTVEGHFTQPAILFEVADDAAAIEHAKRLQVGCDIEIWCGDSVIQLAAPG